MTDTIICTAVRQPHAFYQDATKYSVAFLLNFDCRGTEADPKGRFKLFLQALATPTAFGVYRLVSPLPSPLPVPLPPAPWPFTPAGTATADNTPAGITPVDNIMGWLERRGMTKDGHPAPVDYWLSAELADAAPPETFKLSELKATHYLGSAAAWPAPLPQNAGLVRILTLTPAPPPAHVPSDDPGLIIVPFFDGIEPHTFTPTDFKRVDGVIRFKYKAGNAFPAALAEIRGLDEKAMNATGLVDGETGFLVAPSDPKDAEKVATIVKRIEDRAGSLLWAFPAIHAIDWTGAPTNSPPMPRLVWRAMNGLAALLDPAVISLVMPKPPQPTPAAGPGAAAPPEKRMPNPDGPFVAALAACVDAAWDEASKDNPPPKPPAPKTSGITDFILHNLPPLLKRDHENNPDGNGRGTLVDLLNRLLGIKTDAKFELMDPEGTVKAAPNFLWLLMQSYAAVPPDHLGSTNQFTELLSKASVRFGSAGNLASLEVALSNELGALAQKWQSDDGIEKLVQALFEAIGLFERLGGQPGAPPPIVPGLDKDTAKKAVDKFRAVLAGNFNGLDAAHHAQARLYELHLVKAVSTAVGVAQRWTAKEILDALENTNWFVRRTDSAVDGTSAFRAIRAILPTYAASALPTLDQTHVTTALKDTFDKVRAELFASGGKRRFVPDHAPQPLQIQLAVDSDPSELEDFAHAYNGFGTLVRRVGEKWAYADLAEIKMYNNNDFLKDPAHAERNLITAVPLQPVAIDQQLRLFLQYDGLPFTSQVFANTHAAGQGFDDAPPAFFTFDDPPISGLTNAQFAVLPPLAYGKTYEVAAFVIGTGGALPRSTQANPLIPWTPSNAPQIPPDVPGKTYLQPFVYRRTTAVGRLTINERAQPGLASRIGVGIEGVQPLFRDYPRVGLSGSAVLDIFRNADGTGALSLPKNGQTNSASLRDVWWWGQSGGRLTLSFFYKPGPKPETAPNPTDDDSPLAKLEFPINGAFALDAAQIQLKTEAGEPHTVNVTFSVQLGGDPVTAPAASVPDSVESVWVRVKLAGGDATKIVALSFADPAAEASGEHTTSRPAAESLLLIGPNTTEWRAPYDQPVEADIIFPRVGFNDFDRWLNNDNLADKAKTSNRDHAPSDDDKEKFKSFRRLLLTAYVMRHSNERLGPLVDSLPDLSVDRLLVELTPLDALRDEPTRVVRDSLDGAGKVSGEIPLNTLGKRLQSVPPPHDPAQLKVQDLVDGLAALSSNCTGSLKIQSNDSGKLSIDFGPGNIQEKPFTVNVPRGTVARLTIRPMVHKDYVESDVFSKEIATLATEKRGDYYLFEGASVVIESMLGALAHATPQIWQDQLELDNRRCYKWENLAAKAVAVRAAGAHRSYDLVARPADIGQEANGWWWRQLANIDVATQRWRFTGRPIYSWLDPTSEASGSGADVALEQTWRDDGGTRLDAITRFEAESFFDRDEADADSRTMQLSPAPHETVLQSFPWEQPSATYFRHRLTIRSRYEGALRAGQVAVQRAWGEDDDFRKENLPQKRLAKSWIRVAMRADRTRLQLTRPQLRALIPLTVAPATSADDALPATPPVMAILDERPFAHGGLADRIAAEIRTGFGYELKSTTPPTPPKPLYIADARKEFGPDPRLTYTPTAEDKARAITLENEGPIGLTFDSENVRAAVFANTALVLHPILLTAERAKPASLEEHFLSVGLRRYLDPAWLVGEPGDTHPITNSWWVTWGMKAATDTFSLGADNRHLIEVAQKDGVWTVSFDATLIDPQPLPPPGSPPPPLKTLCAMDAGTVNGLAFLHLPLEKGRASLSVFAQPSDTSASTGDVAILAGAGNQPMVVASIEWQVPAGTSELKFHGSAEEAVASHTSASPTTLMNWTRTGKNFELWHASKDDDLLPCSLAHVVARWTDSGKKSFEFVDVSDASTPKQLNFEPPSSRYPNPLYVHRHHAVISTANAPGIGRPVEFYKGARRSFGGAISRLEGSQAVRLVEFETPAFPLAWGGDAVAKFKTAHFDLVSILGTASVPTRPNLPGLSLLVRPLGSKATNNALTELNLNLNLIFDSLLPTQNPIPIKITLTPDSDSPLRGIILVLINSGDRINLTAKAIYLGNGLEGDNVTISPSSMPKPVSRVQVLELQSTTMKANVAPPLSEFWTDLSLLTLPEPRNQGDSVGPEDFTFDWFFTGGETQAPAEAVTETALRNMVEAQARIIAVSPPIPVEG